MAVTLPAGWDKDPKQAEKVLHVLRKARENRIPAPDFESPLDLLARIDPTTVKTPALKLISDALVEAYTQRGGRLIISMPPQEGKSHLATKAATLWNIMRDQNLRCGIISFGSDLAVGFGKEIRSWITTYDGTDGELDLRLRIEHGNNAATHWKLQGHRGGLLSVGLGGNLTGRPLDALIVDDPFSSPEDAGSPTNREKVWKWFQAVATTRLAPGAPIVIIMTRWHEDDLAGRLIRGEDGGDWRVINIPAQADHDPAKGQTDPLGRQPGEWMISARGRTAEDFETTKRAVGSYTFNALYQGKPSPDDGDILKRNWFRRYTDPLWSIADGTTYRIADGYDELLTSWDMAFKDTKGSDYVVGQVWMRRGPDAFLLDQVRARLDFTATKHAVTALAKKWPQARLHLVEEKANGPAVIASLRKEVSIGAIIPINPKDSKQARASAIAPYLESGSIHIPADDVALFTLTDNSPEAFLEEAAAFPNAAHDDQVDAFTQAIDRFFIGGAGASAWTEALKHRTAIPKSDPETGTTEREVRTVTDLTDSPALDPLAEARRAQLRNL